MACIALTRCFLELLLTFFLIDDTGVELLFLCHWIAWQSLLILSGLSSSQLQYLINDELVIYPGYVSNVQEWIENSSVFVLPSYREGVPRSTQEAMAMGRAVITTDVPGCRETVVHGKNGFLVPPWSPELLAEKMILFMECPSLVESMGLESYKIAQVKFDAVKINQELLSFF